MFVAPAQAADLITGDRVRIRVSHDATGRSSGRVEEILARGISRFLGTVEWRGRTAFVHSADRRIALSCPLTPDTAIGLRGGDWVIARVDKFPSEGKPGAAAVEKRLDPDRPLEIAHESAIARYGLPQEFPAEALREADAHGARVDPGEAARRLDLRGLPLVTIDGEDARDFDDAVYAEPVGDGFRLLVAIADVSHYVRPGTAVDTEARERGTSVYFPQRVLPMLPRALSDHLCSLEPEVDRLCIVADMQITRGGQIGAARFSVAVMRSHARLTYERAHRALFLGESEAVKSLGALHERLLPLVDVYRALLKARRRRGALDLEGGEVKFEFDAGGRVRALAVDSRNEAHKLVEECMIAANVAAARALREAGIGALLRVHAAPEPRKLDALKKTLAALGVAAEIPEEVRTRDLRAIAQRVGEPQLRSLVEQIVVRSMMQAQYRPEGTGHFGLALTEYAHFTSPIRRYPDLVVHRALRAMLDPRDPAGREESPLALAAAGEQLSTLERRAEEADRYADTFLKCSYLRERIGQTFVGLVTAVVEFGCFVRLDEVGADGLLHLDALRDDVYRMDRDGVAWVGDRNRRRIGLGNRIHVIVTGANPVEGLIDLELAE